VGIPLTPVATLAVETAYGPANASLNCAEAPRAALVLGHGAGGGVGARDLVVAAEAAGAEGCTVALVEQPYRVAGRRAPDGAARLDQAWIDVVAALRGRSRLPLVTGGRSSGARVACRTAAATGAAGVVCLAFPLRPPGRPEASRAGELLAVSVPVLVVQGERDAFGGPAELPPGPAVVAVAGDHSLRRSAAAAADAVRRWLDQIVT
jgi:predicted alpha/beta-hydrolase family hydrolase